MRKKYFILINTILLCSFAYSQGPAVTSWLQNTTVTGTYYNSGNSTAISNGILVNCQQVEYSANYVYVTTEGVPSYPTGPFLDGNPSQAQAQSAIYKMPLNPQQNTGNPTSTTMGTIAVFINGASLYDYSDGVAWNPNTNTLCGGPGNSPCPGGPQANMDWNRDAIPAEMDGFDCSKGHPAMGQYHHHQNPSAFKLDIIVLSTICNSYDADGLYSINPSVHSPLIGYAYDGYPIYGAYGYKNSDGTGGIVRIKSSYQLKNITTRPNGPDVNQIITTTGPNGGQESLFLGYFREDYEYVAHPNDDDYLDEHNGRICVTPEYPNGTYAYFATVDSDWNSAYPYAVGPTFYGVYSNASVNSVNETTTIYTPSTTNIDNIDDLNIQIHPNPSNDFIAIQLQGLLHNQLDLELTDMSGKMIQKTKINPGSTIGYLDVSTLYNGTYLIRISNSSKSIVKKVIID